MTTTAHEDQFTAEPEHVTHRPYDAAAILRQNVADLERELLRQRERADRAEAELKAAMGQEPVAHVKYKATGGNVGLSWIAIPTDAYYPREGEQLYTRPIPAPAPAVPEEWREVMAELAADLQASIEAEHAYRNQYSSVMRKYQNDMRIVERARALLQSAEVKK